MQRNDANAVALERHATAGDCSGAEARWLRMRRRMVDKNAWLAHRTPGARRSLAECWARSAAESADRGEQIALLVRARELDHRAPSLRAAAPPLARALFEEGKAARDREAWEEAYHLFSDALRVEPGLAWARRYAEEARGRNLGLKTPARAW
jgi:hypothetical protein